jgi:hypothetical protein
VLSRVDGKTTVKQIVALVGGMLPEAKAVEILKKLKGAGAILIGAPVSAAAVGTPPAVRGAGNPPSGTHRAAAPFVPRSTTTTADRMPAAVATPQASRAASIPPAVSARPAAALDPAILAEAVDLDEAQKRRILEFHCQLPDLTHFEVLGVTEETDKKEVKRAYFKLSKEFHPDRFYKKQLGSYGERLAAIFKALTVAFDTVSDDAQRAAYLLGLRARRK